MRSITLLLSCVFYFLFINMALANYEFDKTRVDLSQQQPIDTIKFSNSGAQSQQPVDLQIKVLRWTQENGNDVYKPTQDLIIAPPQLRIPVGKTQLLRVGWRIPAHISEELAFRIIVSDLTPYTHEKNTILLKLQVNLPVYIKPDTVTYQAQWQVTKINDSQLKILMTNTGNVHITANKIIITNENDELIGSQPTMFVLLPHQSKEGMIKINRSPTQTVTVTVQTDDGNLKGSVKIK